MEQALAQSMEFSYPGLSVAENLRMRENCKDTTEISRAKSVGKRKRKYCCCNFYRASSVSKRGNFSRALCIMINKYVRIKIRMYRALKDAKTNGIVTRCM